MFASDCFIGRLMITPSVAPSGALATRTTVRWKFGSRIVGLATRKKPRSACCATAAWTASARKTATSSRSAARAPIAFTASIDRVLRRHRCADLPRHPQHFFPDHVGVLAEDRVDVRVEDMPEPAVDLAPQLARAPAHVPDVVAGVVRPLLDDP